MTTFVLDNIDLRRCSGRASAVRCEHVFGLLPGGQFLTLIKLMK